MRSIARVYRYIAESLKESKVVKSCRCVKRLIDTDGADETLLLSLRDVEPFVEEGVLF